MEDKSVYGYRNCYRYDPEELIDFKAQSMIANQLMDYKARGHKVEATRTGRCGRNKNL